MDASFKGDTKNKTYIELSEYNNLKVNNTD